MEQEALVFALSALIKAGIIPAVTSADNGKILGIEDGAIKPITVPGAVDLWDYLTVGVLAGGDGEIATTYDAASAPVKSLKLTLPTSETAYTTVSITRCGKNLTNAGTVSFTQDKSVNVQSGIALPAGTYVFSAVVSSTETVSGKCAVNLRKGATTTVSSYLSLNHDTGDRVSGVLTATAAFDRIYLLASDSFSHAEGKTATFTDIQLEKANAVSAYEAYSGETYTVDLTGQGVFGGDVDFPATAKTAAGECNLIPSVGAVTCDYLIRTLSASEIQSMIGA